jgi:hypothetical protein
MKSKSHSHSDTVRDAAERAAMKQLRRDLEMRQQNDAKNLAAIEERTKTWNEKILPNWKSYENSKKLKSLCMKGIPPSLRGKVWPLLIGQHIIITPDMYEDYLTLANDTYLQQKQREQQLDEYYRAAAAATVATTSAVDEVMEKDKDSGSDFVITSSSKGKTPNPVTIDPMTEFGSSTNMQSSSPATTPEETSSGEKPHSGHSASSIPSVSSESLSRTSDYDNMDDIDLLSRAPSTIMLIERDLPRTFPTLGFFHDGGPMQESLQRVLYCYTCCRPDVGYVQGMTFLVAMLLLNMEELEAFQCLVNLMHNRDNIDFFRLEKEAVESFTSCFNHFFKLYLPLLCDHFQTEGVQSEMFLLDWNLTIFSKALPLEAAMRIWDCFLLEGERFVVRAGLGILRMYAPILKSQSIEEIVKVLSRLPNEKSVDELMSHVDWIPINENKFEAVRQQTLTVRPVVRVNGVGIVAPRKKTMFNKMISAVDSAASNARRLRDGASNFVQKQRDSLKAISSGSLSTGTPTDNETDTDDDDASSNNAIDQPEVVQSDDEAISKCQDNGNGDVSADTDTDDATSPKGKNDCTVS